MVVLPLCCFPDRLWFARYRGADSVVIDLGEHYVKQSYRNRFTLMGSHGPFVCTARVQGQKGQKMAMSDIALVDDEWRRVALRGLRSSYARSPFWEHYAERIESIILHKHERLVDLNRAALDFLLDGMGMVEKHRFSDRYVEVDEGWMDFRMDAEPGCEENHLPAYPQVFEDRHGFVGGLSALDLLLNTGPEALNYLG
ncbi:MAG: WbqC family protein [Flavobacteriales bacterium]|jgi:hypothetical protein